MHFIILTFALCFRFFISACECEHAFNFFTENTQANYSDKFDSRQTTFFHNGMKCCKCFFHCACFGQCVGDYEVCFPPDMPNHPHSSIDKAWHEFMKGILTAKKVGPFFVLDRLPLQRLVSYQNDKDRNIHSLSDYLSLIEKFRAIILEARLDRIEFYKYLYSSPQEKGKLKENLQRIEQEYRNATQALNEIPSRIIPLYQEAITNCSHPFLFSVYNKGLIHSLMGDWDIAVVEIQNVIEMAEKNKVNQLDSKIYQTCGEACLEVNLFNEAIAALTTAISKNPENKQSYFFRAAAYFENGNFDEALQDYLMSDKGKSFSTAHKAPREFKKALINSTCQAASEALIDFVPSLCSSVYGLSTTIWAAHPFNPRSLENTSHFANACYEVSEGVIDYCKNVDWNTMEDCVIQIKTLYKRYDQLSDTEKGELIGYIVGKYGVDILAGCLTGGALIKSGELFVKGASTFRNLKNINRACTLETMAVSSTKKEIVTATALKHAAEREFFFKNVRYNFDAHNKHILSHNDYREFRSVWEHSDPEGLLKKFAGKGIPHRGEPGLPNYKEAVDFKEHIGVWKDKVGSQALPTTRGTIHYSNKGAHIVPSNPSPNTK